MAFEVFDDVAFYWFLQVMIGVYLIPSTLNYMWQKVLWYRRYVPPTHMRIKKIPEYLSTTKLKEDKKPMWSLRFIFLSILWVIFIILIIQLPKFHNEKMQNFEPYEILGLEKGAELSAIKRAYRKMSLKWHPDKHKGEKQKEAELKFVLISKAYQALTDEAMKENYAKYGNVDGYQGISVTIGLPAFLTDKTNEAIILLVYFVGLIVLCIVMALWWTVSTRYHKSGALNDTVRIYHRCVKQKDTGRTLLNVLAASAEYQDVELLLLEDPMKMEMIELLRKQIFNSGKKINKLPEAWAKCNYIRWTSTLLHAFLLGNLPTQLQNELRFILQEAPRLLDVMIDLTLTRSDFMKTGIALIELKQRLLQGIWFGEPDLCQLPFKGGSKKEILEGLKQQGYKRLLDCCQCKPEDFDQVLKEVCDEEQYLSSGHNVSEMLKMVPDIDVKLCWRTVDEAQIYEGDIVTITIILERLKNPWELPMPRSSEMKPPEIERKEKGLTTDDELDQLEFDKQHRIKLTNFDAPISHSSAYPFQLREKWMVMLYDKVPNRYNFLMRAKAIPALTTKETMEFQFHAGAPDKKTLGIRLMCDSYIGCDKEIEFNVVIKERPKDVAEELKAEQEYNIPDDNMWDSEGKWYYMYCDSLIEMICTLIILFLMGVAFLQSKFGKKYAKPWIDWGWSIVAPHWKTIVEPHVVVMGEFMEEQGIGFEWMWDEEAAKAARKAEEEEQQKRDEAERMREEERLKREKEDLENE